MIHPHLFCEEDGARQVSTSDQPKHPFIADISVRKFTDNNNYLLLRLIPSNEKREKQTIE